MSKIYCIVNMGPGIVRMLGKVGRVSRFCGPRSTLREMAMDERAMGYGYDAKERASDVVEHVWAFLGRPSVVCGAHTILSDRPSQTFLVHG